MFLNDLNTADDVVVSPLKHDVDGRFSRKGTPVDEQQHYYNINLIENILIFIFIFCLIATDFILFAGSGNIKIFDNSIFPIPEVLWILLGIALFTCVLVYIFNKNRIMKYLLAALISLFFIYILFRQFAQTSQNLTIGNNEIPLSIIVGCIISGLTFVVLIQDKILYKVLSVVTVFIIFLHIYISYISPRDDISYDFVESHNTQKDVTLDNKRFIYFMFPNLVSYPYLSTISGLEAADTQKIIQGFFQKNKFRVYTHAYVPEDNYLFNMVHNFNLASHKKMRDYLMNTRLISSYWSFYNIKHEYIYFRENELYDIFRKNKFQISAYKSRDVDMCHKKHKFNVNRCVEKINRPTILYDMTDIMEKTKLLFIEWVSSMKLMTDMSSLYNMLSMFIDVDTAPMIGINYNNLYVVNSIMTFDLLMENIRQDTGKQAYFVFIDMPSDMYIYDEFCHIKPRHEWLNMLNLPWITHDYTGKRQKAYLQQTRCLFGKLEQFVENMKRENKWKDSVVVVQGISSVNDFKNYPIENAKENFMKNRLVNMAIYDNQFEREASFVDDKLCSIHGILAEYLFKSEQCSKSKINIHSKILHEINDRVSKLSINIHKNVVPVFKRWYEKWTKANSDKVFDENRIIKTESSVAEDFGLDELEINNIQLNDQVFEK